MRAACLKMMYGIQTDRFVYFRLFTSDLVNLSCCCQSYTAFIAPGICPCFIYLTQAARPMKQQNTLFRLMEVGKI